MTDRVAWCCCPPMHPGLWGLLLIALGAGWALSAAGVLEGFWTYAGPLALIVVGAAMLWRPRTVRLQ